jgi:hypothetical protein
MGRHGLYYRQTLSPARGRSMPTTVSPPAQIVPPGSEGTHSPFHEITSSDPCQIRDSSSEALLAEIREKRGKVSSTLAAAILSAVIIWIAIASNWPAWVLLAIASGCGIALFYARLHDKLEKTVVIFYNFEFEVETAFKLFCEWASALAATSRVWHVDAASVVYNRKYHAGASQLLRRSTARIRESAPPFVQTNVPVYSIVAGRNTLYLFPDRLLVYNSRDIGAVSYGSVDIQASSQRFIEEGGVPSDATVVDYTWRYVNKDGGPDRRFNNNPRIPICNYDELVLKTSSGLNELLQLSCSGIGERFAAALKHLASVTPVVSATPIAAAVHAPLAGPVVPGLGA